MAQTVDEVLAARRRASRGNNGPAVAATVLLHLLMAAAALVLPRLQHTPPPRLEIQPVRLVPAQRLGSRIAPPERESRPVPRPERQPPAPEPEPLEPQAPPEPEPEPVEPTRAAPPLEDRSRGEAAEGRPAPPEPPAERRGSPEGDPTAASAFGSRVSGLDPAFTYDYYIQRMLAAIEGQWRRPGVEAPLEVTVHFTIERDGTVRDLRVVETSGHRPFDLAALRAVQRASPLPPLPRSYRKDSLGVNLIVR